MVVPIAGAALELEDCVGSLLAHTDFRHHRLVLVLDGPARAATERLIGDLADHDVARLDVLRNDRLLGFVASVNRAMERSRRDVVLLNSDTVVTSRWLEKLQQAAYSSPLIATATPFSNNATLCSLPRGGEENLLPTGVTPISPSGSVFSVAEVSHQMLAERAAPPVASRCSVRIRPYVRRQSGRSPLV